MVRTLIVSALLLAGCSTEATEREERLEKFIEQRDAETNDFDIGADAAAKDLARDRMRLGRDYETGRLVVGNGAAEEAGNATSR